MQLCGVMQSVLEAWQVPSTENAKSIENINKPRTAKVGAISKAQNLKGGPFGLRETPAGCKKFLKIEGGPFGDMKTFLNEIFEQCHSAEKCKRGTLCDFLTSVTSTSQHQIFDEKFDQEPENVRIKMADLAGP